MISTTKDKLKKLANLMRELEIELSIDVTESYPHVATFEIHLDKKRFIVGCHEDCTYDFKDISNLLKYDK